MNLVSVGLARAVWLIDATEMNPRGRNLDYSLFPALVDRYHFRKYPDLDEQDDDEEKKDKEPGFKFTEGVFTNPEGVDVAVNLTLYADGLVAETRSSTDDCDVFLGSA